MRQCAFCPSTKLTREHLWPDWINSILPQKEIEFTTRRRLSPDDRDPTEWRSMGLNLKAKVVCATCNTGWMSNFESQEAKPTMTDMIRYGGPVSILPRGIAAIAAFGFKMTVLANFAGKLKNEPFFTESERYNFARTLQVPPNVQMWLFVFNTPRRIAGKFNSHLGRLENKVKYRFELYIGTFAIGRFGIQVVASRWANPHMGAFLGKFPGVREGERWEGATVPLLPSDGSPVLWPPRFHIDSNTIDELTNRWKDIHVPDVWLEGHPL